MENITYNSIIYCIETKPNIQDITKIGLCRVWTKAAMEYIKSNFPNVLVEAREVDLEPDLQHTFLRMSINGQRPFLADGIGSAKYQPYFGFEDEAPTHLQNSRSDVINNL
jgi:hypothetical protein